MPTPPAQAGANIYSTNLSEYERKYKQGYGLTVPDGHVIRIHHQILRYELKVPGGNLLDFGCGTGTHAKWLAENGNWTPFGCDISATAIEAAKKQMPQWARNFVVCDSLPDLSSLFKEKFDFVFTNQVLYYFDNAQLRRIVEEFYSLLNPGGLFFASMMARENYYFSRSFEMPGSEMRKVELRGRLNDTTYINFKGTTEMEDDFRMFKKLHVGYYDTIIREDEGSTKHIWYLGKK